MTIQMRCEYYLEPSTSRDSRKWMRKCWLRLLFSLTNTIAGGHSDLGLKFGSKETWERPMLQKITLCFWLRFSSDSQFHLLACLGIFLSTTLQSSCILFGRAMDCMTCYLRVSRICDLVVGIKVLQALLEDKIQDVVECLRYSSSTYETQTYICTYCGYNHYGRYQPASCSDCGNRTFYHKACTTDTRILGYLDFLGRAKLLFSIIPTRDSSISDLASTIIGIYDKNEHRCSGGRDCRLKKELKALACAAEDIADQVTGLSLPPLHGDDNGPIM